MTFKLYELGWHDEGVGGWERAHVVAYTPVDAVAAFQRAHPYVVEFSVKLDATEFLGVFVGEGAK